MKLTGHKSVDVHGRYTHMQLEPLKTGEAFALRAQACRTSRDSAAPVASSRSSESWRSEMTRWVSSVLAQKMPPGEPSSLGIGLYEKV